MTYVTIKCVICDNIQEWKAESSLETCDACNKIIVRTVSPTVNADVPPIDSRRTDNY